MTARALAAALATISLLLGAHLVAQQETVRTRVEGVRVDVTVTDGGRPVLGLTQDDFELLDNGIPQSIQSSRAVGRLSVALALDTSASVVFGRMEFHRVVRPTPENFNQLLRATRSILSSLASEDEVCLLTFSDRLTLAAAPTTSASAVAEALSHPARIQPPGTQIRSTVWDAVFAAASLAASRPGRPIVFALTDGTDNASWFSQPDVIAALRRAGVSIDVVSVPRTYDTLDEDPPGNWDVDAVSKPTGGEAFSARDPELDGRLRQRLNVLRSGYILTYTPAGVGRTDGWHGITVRLRHAKGRVQARPGYYATAAGAN